MSVVVGGIYFKEFDELYGSHIAAVIAGERLVPLCGVPIGGVSAQKGHD